MKITCFLLIIALISSHSTCMSKRKDTFFSVRSITMSKDREVYVKRMVRGPGYDRSVTVISMSPDLYDFNAATADYVFDSFQPSLYYRVENDTLKLYLYGQPAHSPKQGEFPVHIEQVVLGLNDYLKMTENYQRLGIERLDLFMEEARRRQL